MGINPSFISRDTDTQENAIVASAIVLRESFLTGTSDFIFIGSGRGNDTKIMDLSIASLNKR